MTGIGKVENETLEVLHLAEARVTFARNAAMLSCLAKKSWRSLQNEGRSGNGKVKSHNLPKHTILHSGGGSETANTHAHAHIYRYILKHSTLCQAEMLQCAICPPWIQQYYPSHFIPGPTTTTATSRQGQQECQCFPASTNFLLC